MTIAARKAVRINALRSYAGWSVKRLSKRFGVSAQTVRNMQKDPERAECARRTRQRNVKEIASRRAAIARIAAVKRYEVVRGRRVEEGKLYASGAAILGEYERRMKGRRATTLPTVYRDMKALGLKSLVRPKVVNNDPVKNLARLNFARQLKRLGIKGKQVVFSDECWANNNDNTHRREWVFEGESPSPRKYQKRAEIKLMIWGAIGLNFKSELRFIEGSMDATQYQQTMLQVIVKAFKRRKNCYFMQDNARPHSARSTAKFLSDAGIKTLEWPAYSPHLNPIEKLWNHIHFLIAKRRPRDVDDLKAKAQEVWDSLSQEMINRYVLGFDDAIERCIREKGRPW